ncbi:MAG: hypothetical protein EHM33_02005 [Chloroflexi bacterium]|nr:MAG: hypothetical protein EHM33_02005 [Chloroflexota bacterium]
MAGVLLPIYTQKGKMQSKQTNRLARKIRKNREKKIKGKLTRWMVVCEKLNIRTEDGRLDPGLAFKIGYQDYEPSDRGVRQRLGLRDMCTRCKRVFRAVKVTTPQRALSPARAWWNGLARGQREELIEKTYRNYLNWRSKK